VYPSGWATWGFGGNVSFGYYAFLEYVCRPDVVLGDDVPSETKAYVQTTRAMVKVAFRFSWPLFVMFGFVLTSVFLDSVSIRLGNVGFRRECFFWLLRFP